MPHPTFGSAAREPFFPATRVVRLLRDEVSMNVQPHMRMDKPAFLAWADGREGRCELVGGRVVMMVGASRAHGRIVKNLLTALDRRLDPTWWLVLADFGVDVGPDTLRYPDILVEDAGGDPKSFTTASPVFVAEVLSPSTTTVDLGDKAAEYLKLASLAAYVVLSQDEPKGVGAGARGGRISAGSAGGRRRGRRDRDHRVRPRSAALGALRRPRCYLTDAEK
jgi:Uma2 family endonuclease